MMMSGKPSGGLPIEGDIPSLRGATAWLNSPALSSEELRGKVVLVDFWTYSCINCLRALPYVKTWYAKYKDHGLVVIGVHAPEFAFEKLPSGGVEPLRAELEAFLDAVRTGKEPKTNGPAGRAALELATRVTTCIREHAARVQPTGSQPGLDLPVFAYPRKDEK